MPLFHDRTCMGYLMTNQAFLCAAGAFMIEINNIRLLTNTRSFRAGDDPRSFHAPGHMAAVRSALAHAFGRSRTLPASFDLGDELFGL